MKKKSKSVTKKPTAKPIECWDYYKVDEKAEAVLNKAKRIL